MIGDVKDLNDGALLRGDVVIVGAGFAGIDLARSLGRAGRRVILLESGRVDFDPHTQDLARITSAGKPLRRPDPESPFTPYLPEIFRGEFRVRQLGGTSGIWTGKWRRFDPLDFAVRRWVPHSGWPITRAQLEPYYRQVCADYGLPDFDAFGQNPAIAAVRERLGEAGLELSFHYWEKTPTRPGVTFREELERSASVGLWLGANVTEIVLDSSLTRVESVVFKSLDGRTFRASADSFVLAPGGLEGARLLLASNNQLPRGIGNHHGLVGRFHHDHPKHKGGRLWPGPAMKRLHAWTRTEPRPTFHVSLSLSDEVQEHRRLLDHAVYFRPVYSYQVDYPQDLVDRLKGALAARRPLNVLASVLSLLASPQSGSKVFQRWRHADRSGRVAYYLLSMYVEQAPNPESTLSLSDERDALGMRRLVVNWQVNEQDHESLEKVLRGLADACAKAGIGRLDYGPDGLTLDRMVDAAHHMGATRMAATPATGVVDADCRVFGTDNLFIVSSSVFPTGHSAAPTMTILALAKRLAEHLLAGPAGRSAAEIVDG